MLFLAIKELLILIFYLEDDEKIKIKTKRLITHRFS
jgi:hypothetical protein